MKKYLSNKLNSYHAVIGVLKGNRDIIESVALMGQSVEEFYNKVEEIGTVDAQTKRDTPGATKAKKLAKEKLAVLASTLAASASIYAWDNSDTELEASLGFSYTDIKYARDSVALARAMVVESDLLKHRRRLEGYMVTEKDLEDLHQLILSYDDAMKAAGGLKSDRVANFRKLEKLFHEADNILTRKIDRFVLRLKTEFPDFYVAYTNARSIVDL